MASGKIKRLYLIPILSKALDVLEMLEEQNASMTLEDVYQRTQISKTSVYRILKTLVHRGYVAHGESGEYRLVSRPKRLRFGLAVQSADLPFSQQVATSVTAAAASSGVELIVLDNHFDAETAIRNAEEFVTKRVDLVLEFQAEEHVAPHVAYIFKNAGVPLDAVVPTDPDVPGTDPEVPDAESCLLDPHAATRHVVPTSATADRITRRLVGCSPRFL